MNTEKHFFAKLVLPKFIKSEDLIGTVEGGDVVWEEDGYQYRQFNSTANLVISNQNLNNVHCLVVGGGGGGGGISGGGGGEVVFSESYGTPITLAAGTHAVTIGAGGAGAPDGGSLGTNGGNSSFKTFTALGGGGGGGVSDTEANRIGQSGGSGGGFGVRLSTPYTFQAPVANTSKTQGYGNSGTRSVDGNAGLQNAGGGGGGASEAGKISYNEVTRTESVDRGGEGGNGYYFYRTNQSYGAGGGGGSFQLGGKGGAGGGGNGVSRVFDLEATVGAANTGSGGGGGVKNSMAESVGAAGGSGIVIIYYPLQQNAINETRELWLGSSSYVEDELYSGSPKIYPILNSITGLGLRMGEHLPEVRSGSISIKSLRGSLDYNKRFYDLLEDYALLDQLVEIYSFEKPQDGIGLESSLTLIFKSQVVGYSIDTEEGLINLDISAPDIGAGALFFEQVLFSESAPLVIGDSQYIKPLISEDRRREIRRRLFLISEYLIAPKALSFFNATSSNEVYANKDSSYFEKLLTEFYDEVAVVGTHEAPFTYASDLRDLYIPLLNFNETQLKYIFDSVSFKLKQETTFTGEASGNIEVSLGRLKSNKPPMATFFDAAFDALTDVWRADKTTMGIFDGIFGEHLAWFQKPLLETFESYSEADFLVRLAMHIKHEEGDGGRGIVTRINRPSTGNHLALRRDAATNGSFVQMLDSPSQYNTFGAEGFYGTFCTEKDKQQSIYNKIISIIDPSEYNNSDLVDRDTLVYPSKKLSLFFKVGGIQKGEYNGNFFPNSADIITRIDEVLLFLFYLKNNSGIGLADIIKFDRFPDALNHLVNINGIVDTAIEFRELLLLVLQNSCSALIPDNDGGYQFWTYGTEQEPVAVISENECKLISVEASNVEDLANTIEVRFDRRLDFGATGREEDYLHRQSIKLTNFASLSAYSLRVGLLENTSLDLINDAPAALRFGEYYLLRFGKETFTYAISVPYWRANYRNIKVWDTIELTHIDVPSIQGSESSQDAQNLIESGEEVSADWFEGFFPRHANRVTLRVIGIEPDINVDTSEAELIFILKTLKGQVH